MACAISRALGRDPVGVSPFTAGQFVEQALSAIGLVIMANFVELLTAVADELAGNGCSTSPEYADGAIVQKPEVRVAPGYGIYELASSETRYQLLPDGLLQLAAST